jgi:hypothetical protein
MPASRDGFSRLRVSAETRVKQALAQTRGGATGNDGIFARARLASADITERYWVEQVLSVSPSERMGEKPKGKIEMAIPYDGCKFFTRQAKDDVLAALAGGGQHGGNAGVGHLVLHNYTKTDLGSKLSLSDNHDAVRIEALLGDPGLLSADQQTCVNECEFSPAEPEVIPAQLEIGLHDPDSLDVLRLELDRLSLARLSQPDNETYGLIDSVIGKIKQQVSFRNDLLLTIRIGLALPVGRNGELPVARVTRMAIGWPTITSLRTLRLLTYGDQGYGTESEAVVPVRYNPEETSLEWEDIRIPQPARKPNEDHAHYASLFMLLSIQHPGELYQQKKLEISAELEVSDYLLSGLKARLYEADGRPSDKQPKLTTKVHVDAKLTLDDAFARRDFTPSQHLFFDEVIPAETRITEIRNSLEEKGFVVSPSSSQPLPGSNAETVRWFLKAERQEGPYTMELWIVVEGRHFITMEETTRGAGQTHTTERQTGDLQVYIRGALPRDSKALTHEMNALQRKLRERYGRVRQRR